MYVRYNKLSGDELLIRAWAECIRGVDRMIDVYGLGKAPRYPAIDSTTYDAKSDAYKSAVQSLWSRCSKKIARLRSFLYDLDAVRAGTDAAPDHRDRPLRADGDDQAGRISPREIG